MGEHNYVGELDKDNNACGYGVLKYSTGAQYEGTFKDNKREGLGIWTWANGIIIIGEFSANLSKGIRTTYM